MDAWVNAWRAVGIELTRTWVLVQVQVRVWRARWCARRAKALNVEAAWQRSEAQHLLDDMPASLFFPGR